jgi:uncharacterized membrane protein
MCPEAPAQAEIATIYYASYDMWGVKAGKVVEGAKFRSLVPMADTQKTALQNL